MLDATTRRVLAATLVVALLHAASAAQPVSPANRNFGHAIKNGPLDCKAGELTTFVHNCTAPPCTITQIHVPSIYPQNGDAFNWESGRLRVYVDGESTPSIDVTLLELASVGHSAAINDQTPVDGSPFANELFGKTAASGGVSTTARIPFSKSVRTAIVPPATCTSTAIFWFIVRGVESLPVTLGNDLVLPDQAKLWVQRTQNTTLQPLQFLTIAEVPAGYAGALLLVMFDAVSTDSNYLEACIRYYPDGAQSPLFLSSGTEDYFLSASYFDEGRFTTPESGLTYLDPNSGSKSMYKVHTRDLLLFQNGLNMTWRNMEDGLCPNKWPWPAGSDAGRPPVPGVAPMTPTTLVWLYTWPAADATFSGRARGPAGHAELTASLDYVRQLANDKLLDAEEEVAVVKRLTARGVQSAGLRSLVASYRHETDRARVARLIVASIDA